MTLKANRLLLEYLDLLKGVDSPLPVLDLACGSGRNGLVLAEQRIPVVFADRSSADLNAIEQQLTESDLPGRTWQVDLEQPGVNPLAGKHFSAVLVFNYLHRPLIPALRDAVIPGGLVIYETFTVQQPRFGRPKNPDFLLQPGELKAIFQGWDIVHNFEGIALNPDRAVAHIVALKPVENSC